MKKRDRILLLSVFLTALIITALTILAKFQLEQFKTAYYEEEKEEIAVLAKQISWAIKPVLKTKNYKDLQEFCSLFNDSDTSIIVKKDNKIIADSSIEIPNKEKDNNDDKTFIISQTVYHSMPIKAGDEIYTLTIATTIQDINKTMIKAKRIIIWTIITGTFIIIILSLYVYSIYKSFNRLQNSAINIAEGNLDCEIFIPRSGILYELACAVKKMSKRLKLQISELQKLENFRSDFIASISHEIKTPLTAILSAVEILEVQTPKENPAVTKCLTILNTQSQRLNSLVQDILSLSEIEKRKTAEEKDFKKINLENIIKNSILMCSVSDMKINTDLETVEIEGDGSLIERALINLIMNAIKYSKSETIDITLKQKNNNAEIRIKDYGIGIPQEHLPRIFEHFYRVDKARSRDIGGTGLGLAIVKNIIKLHGGNIEAFSNNGCEFVITLPLC